jgi:flavin reductase (DIM6/NTAB) family NADH-FMN oxidoreductase RutF
MHVQVDPKVLYFGTPVVLVSTLNQDGSPNLAPMSSAWWLGRSAMLGLDATSQTTANLARDGECVLNLTTSDLVDAVDRLALLTGSPVLPRHKAEKGFRHVADKFTAANLTPIPSELVGPPRVAESPVQLEGKVVAMNPFGAPHAEAFGVEIQVERVHVDDRLLVPGRPDHIDPVAWDPLIMKFAEFFSGGTNVHPSRLASAFGLDNAGTGVRRVSSPDRVAEQVPVHAFS